MKSGSYRAFIILSVFNQMKPAETLTAHGYVSYPENYKEATNKMKALFTNLYEEKQKQ